LQGGGKSRSFRQSSGIAGKIPALGKVAGCDVEFYGINSE
jgi:hypothetical protein